MATRRPRARTAPPAARDCVGTHPFGALPARRRCERGGAWARGWAKPVLLSRNLGHLRVPTVGAEPVRLPPSRITRLPNATFRRGPGYHDRHPCTPRPPH